MEDREILKEAYHLAHAYFDFFEGCYDPKDGPIILEVLAINFMKLARDISSNIDNNYLYDNTKPYLYRMVNEYKTKIR